MSPSRTHVIKRDDGWAVKRLLEEEKYSVQKTLSDLSFSDTECHKGEPEELVYVVRNWFQKTGYSDIESPSSIWDAYNYFYADLFEKKTTDGFSKKAIERLPMSEFLEEIRYWCS